MFVKFVQHVANLPSLNANVRKLVQNKINEKGLIEQCEQFFQVKNINCSKIHSFTCCILLENVSNLIEVLVQVSFWFTLSSVSLWMCVLLNLLTCLVVCMYFNVSPSFLPNKLSYILSSRFCVLIVETIEEFAFQEKFLLSFSISHGNKSNSF